MKRFLSGFYIVIVLSLTACGQSGPLYLPDNQPPRVPPVHHH